MGVDLLPSGRYRTRLMIDGVTCTATFATEAEACEWLVVTRGCAAGARAAGMLTVEDYALRWLREFIDTAGDLDRYRRDLATRIIPGLGSRVLVEVTPAEILALLEQVRADASPATAAQVLGTLEELFADAADDGIIAPSPVPAALRAASGPAHP
jgi:hypothetical protein